MRSERRRTAIGAFVAACAAGAALLPGAALAATQDPLVLNATSPAAYGSVQTLSTSGGSGGGAVSYSLSLDSTACSLFGDQLTLTAASGVCDVTAAKDGDGTFDPAVSPDVQITPTKAAQSAPTVGAVPAATFGDDPITLTATSGAIHGTGAFSYSTGSSTACSVSADQLTILHGSGSCAVTATQVGDASYNDSPASTPVTVSLARAPQNPLQVDAPSSAAFGDLIALDTTGGSSGAAVSFDTGTSTACSVSPDGQLSIIHGSGTCTVTATMAGNADYLPVSSDPLSIDVAPGQQDPLFVDGPDTLTFGDPSFTLAVEGGTSGGAVTYDVGDSTACTVSGDQLQVTSGTGTCNVTATMAGSTDYLPVSSDPTPVSIQQAAQAVLTLNAPDTLTFGDPAATLSVGGGTTGGTVSYDDTGSDACSVTGDQLQITHGTGTCVITATMDGNDNYAPVTSDPVFVTVQVAGQAPLALVAPATSPYGTTSTLTTTGGNGTGDVSYDAGISDACTVSGDQLTITKGTGLCELTATKDGDLDYGAISSDPVTVAVKKSPATLGTVSGTVVAQVVAPSTTASVRINAKVVPPAGVTVDLTKAKVSFSLYKSTNLTGTPNLTASATVSSTGSASSVVKLTPDVWTVVARVQTTNGYFTSGLSDAQVISVRPTAATLTAPYVAGAGRVLDPSYLNKPVAAAANGYFGLLLLGTGQHAVYTYKGAANGRLYMVHANVASAAASSPFYAPCTTVVLNAVTGGTIGTIANLNCTFLATDSHSSLYKDTFGMQALYASNNTLWHRVETANADPEPLISGAIGINRAP